MSKRGNRWLARHMLRVINDVDSLEVYAVPVVSSDSWQRSSARWWPLPVAWRRHVTCGWGSPVALHTSVTSSPSCTMTSSLDHVSSICGATVHVHTINTLRHRKPLVVATHIFIVYSRYRTSYSRRMKSCSHW